MFNSYSGDLNLQRIPLKRMGLDKKWKRLDKMQDEIFDLERRRKQAERDLEIAHMAVDAAKDTDAAAAAAALRKGKDMPAPENEAKAYEDVAASERLLNALTRALHAAAAEYSEYESD